jgi:hypothetical protein
MVKHKSCPFDHKTSHWSYLVCWYSSAKGGHSAHFKLLNLLILNITSSFSWFVLQIVQQLIELLKNKNDVIGIIRSKVQHSVDMDS